MSEERSPTPAPAPPAIPNAAQTPHTPPTNAAAQTPGRCRTSRSSTPRRPPRSPGPGGCGSSRRSSRRGSARLKPPVSICQNLVRASRACLRWSSSGRAWRTSVRTTSATRRGGTGRGGHPDGPSRAWASPGSSRARRRRQRGSAPRFPSGSFQTSLPRSDRTSACSWRRT